jgi:hypothetical protein
MSFWVLVVAEQCLSRSAILSLQVVALAAVDTVVMQICILAVVALVVIKQAPLRHLLKPLTQLSLVLEQVRVRLLLEQESVHLFQEPA